MMKRGEKKSGQYGALPTGKQEKKRGGFPVISLEKPVTRNEPDNKGSDSYFPLKQKRDIFPF